MRNARTAASLAGTRLLRAWLTAACLVLAASALALPAPTPLAPESGSAQIRDEIARYLRERFSIADTTTITVGPLRPSIYAGFDVTTVTIAAPGKDKASQDFYVSKDGRYLVQGDIYTLGTDPRTEVERLINTQDQPSVGPPNAPVSVVEYADLECPMCAEMQQFMEKQLLPKYGNKVRIIFKEFPLFNIHPWAVVAALACQCAYQINPADFVAYRSLVFQNQKAVKVDTARQQLLDLGAQAGLDRDKLAACIDSKAAMPRVRQDYLEGEKLGVGSTPTFFINGKMFAGALPPAEFFKAIDQALAEAAKK